MEGRLPKAMVLLFADYRDGADPAEVEQWLREQHAEARFKADHVLYYEAAGSMMKDDQPALLALCEPESDDQLPTFAALQAVLPENDALIVRQCGAVKQFGRFVAAEGRESAGLMIGIANCKDPAREAEFQRWYDDVHAANVVKSGIFWSRQRFRTVQQHTLDAEFYAFYESELEEPEASRQYLKWPERDTEFHEMLDLKHVWQYNKLYGKLAG